MSADLLAPLDDRQRVVAQAASGPVAVLAVAGAGKTRAIAHRIAYAVAVGAQEAERGLALTYTSKAAYELRARLASLGVSGVSVGTIHSLALRQLNYFWPKLVGGPIPTLVSNRELELMRILEGIAPDLPATDARRLRAELEWAKATGLDLAALLALKSPPTEEAGLLTGLWQQYEEQNLRSRRIDFDDLLQLLTGLLELRPDAAEEVRRRYTWVNVDEYQDITPLQEALLRQWLGERRELCVVGDVNQAIYGFAGADSSLLATFAQRYPEATVLELEQSYRCPAVVADFAASFLPAAGLQPRAVSEGGVLSLTGYDSVEAEHSALAAQVRALLRSGVDAREIAVLVRVGAQLESIERAFAAADLPFSSRGAVAVNHPVVRRAMLTLRASGANPSGPDLQEAVRGAVLAAGWVESDTDSDQWGAGSALLALAADLLAADPAADLAAYTAELERRLTALSPPRPVAVTLATMHSAKGLEWQHVFLPGLSDRLLPYPGADTAAERNLLYVAVTRASAGLYLSWSSMDERGRPAELTPLLVGGRSGEVLAAAAPAPRLAVSAPGVSTPELGNRQLAECSDCGGPLTSYRERLLGRCQACQTGLAPELMVSRVKEWRAALAAAVHAREADLLSDELVERLVADPPVDLPAFRELEADHSLISDFAAELLLKLLRV